MKTGNFTDHESLLAAVRDYVESKGFTIERNDYVSSDLTRGKDLIISRDGLYFAFKSYSSFDPLLLNDRFDLGAGVVCCVCRGFDEGEEWSDQPGLVKGHVGRSALVAGVAGRYRFFEIDGCVLLTTEYETGGCSVLVFGQLPTLVSSGGQAVSSSHTYYISDPGRPLFSESYIYYEFGGQAGFLSSSAIESTLTGYRAPVFDVYDPARFSGFPLDLRLYVIDGAGSARPYAGFSDMYFAGMDKIEAFDTVSVAGSQFLVIPFGKKPDPFERDDIYEGFGLLVKI